MTIKSIRIRRYRGLDEFEWQPSKGINCLIGPGNVGKSTVLSAISLLLSPRPAPSTSEYDYHFREVDAGFEIRAVLGDLDRTITDTMRVPPFHGWKDGKLTPLPDEDGAEPVLVARVRGTEDLEIIHELLGPGGGDSGETYRFSVSLRREFLLASIASGSRAARELSMGRGSLLERHMGEADLRGPLSKAVAQASGNLELPESANESMEALRALFQKAGLPSELHLGLFTIQDRSLLGMIGLLEGASLDSAIPLAFSGSGTRQLALFRLTSALVGRDPLVLLDEPEIGLEPYRQRALVSELKGLLGERGQCFLSTHSPAVLEMLEASEIVRVASNRKPIPLGRPGITKVLRHDPSAFLSRLPILCEGDTEAGLLSALLPSHAEADGLSSLDSLGVRLVCRQGQPGVLDEAEGLLKANIACGLFVDAESQHSGRRDRISKNPLCAVGSWRDVRNVEEAVARWLSFGHLNQLLESAETSGNRSQGSLLKQVGQAAEKPGAGSLDALAAEVGEDGVRVALAKAMQARGRAWFKTFMGGRALGELLLEVGIPDEINDVIGSFWREVRGLLT